MPYSAQAPWFVKNEAKSIVHGGMLGGSGMGRTDNLPINVPSGAYIVPSDVTSGLGDGNSAAGAKILASFFGSGPLGMPAMHGHGGFGGPRQARLGMMKLPRGAGTGSIFTPTKSPGFQDGGATQHTPIVAASGEYVLHPNIVQKLGGGDLRRGHDVLDELMKILRAKNIAKLKALPPPVKRDYRNTP